MEIVNVLAAAVAAWIFGAIWYGLLSKQWMAASGLTENDIDKKDFVPHIVSLVAAILVAGMTRHILAASGVATPVGGLIAGLGLGLFVATPWVVMNVFYGQRDRNLIWIDGLFPAAGTALIGFVLNLF